MKHLAWLTDIHLNFLRPPVLEAFLAHLAGTEADAFLLGGDIGEAPDVTRHLDAIATAVQRPVYFVLGNHDFYRGTIAGVRAEVRRMCAASANLHYLPDAGVVPLTDATCLVGHDGWGDALLTAFLLPEADEVLQVVRGVRERRDERHGSERENRDVPLVERASIEQTRKSGPRE